MYDEAPHKNTCTAVGDPVLCGVCGGPMPEGSALREGHTRGNTTRFEKCVYTLRQCPSCESLATQGPVDYEDIYSDYPLKQRRLDLFARIWQGRLLARLTSCGLKIDHSILDFGCGNGILPQFLENKGYTQVAGYDPYDPGYLQRPKPGETFDLVIVNDVIEHTHDPVRLMEEALSHVRPGGLIYVGTAESDGVSLDDLEPHLMRLHMPFHRTIFSERGLHSFGARFGLEAVRSWKRSYMDTWWPGCNYRALDETNRALGHRIDLCFDPASVLSVMWRPRLWFFMLFGCFFPCAYEPAVLWRKPVADRKAAM